MPPGSAHVTRLPRAACKLPLCDAPCTLRAPDLLGARTAPQPPPLAPSPGCPQGRNSPWCARGNKGLQRYPGRCTPWCLYVWKVEGCGWCVVQGQGRPVCTCKPSAPFQSVLLGVPCRCSPPPPPREGAGCHIFLPCRVGACTGSPFPPGHAAASCTPPGTALSGCSEDPGFSPAPPGPELGGLGCRWDSSLPYLSTAASPARKWDAPHPARVHARVGDLAPGTGAGEGGEAEGNSQRSWGRARDRAEPACHAVPLGQTLTPAISSAGLAPATPQGFCLVNKVAPTSQGRLVAAGTVAPSHQRPDATEWDPLCFPQSPESPTAGQEPRAAGG